MRSATRRERIAVSDPAEIRQRIECSLREWTDPALVEEGVSPIAIAPGRFSLDADTHGCRLHVWSDEANLVRRITAVTDSGAGRLELRAKRFGNADAKLILIDRAAVGTATLRSAGKGVFREFLRRLLRGAFRDWEIRKLSSAADLEHSLSAIYTRCVLDRRTACWAVIAAPKTLSTADQDHILTQGLIWLDVVMRSSRKIVAGLRLAVPQGTGAVTLQRLNFLTSSLQFELYEYDEHGNLTLLQAADHGNFDTRLEPCLEPLTPGGRTSEQLRALLSDDRFDCIASPEGGLSVRARGIEFARVVGNRMTYGLAKRTPVAAGNFDRVQALGSEILRLRSAGCADQMNPIYRDYPERWLESQVRRSFARLDPALLADPIYAHVPAVGGRERGIIDLLAVDRTGRLAILELKASEDIHLPLQALDYWIRVKWHLERSQFTEQGYFQGLPVLQRPPRLILLAPAIEFHPTTEVILQFLSPEVEVERIGVSENWRSELRIEFRRKGAQRLA